MSDRRPRAWIAAAIAVAALVAATGSGARAAEEPMPTDAPAQPLEDDFFLRPAKAGTWAVLDAYTLGAQASLEQRISIQRDDYAAFVPRLGALASLGFGEVGAHADLRFLFFNIGASAGYRRVWRTYTFDPGVRGTRDERLAIDADKAFTTEHWGYAEARARMALPVTEHLLFVGNAALRYEDSPDNTFDWLHSTVHDRGFLYRYDVTLFLRSPSFGAVGPTARVMDLPRDGERVVELVGGISAGRHIGLLPYDLLVANVLVRPGDPSFGIHILRVPVFALLVYRVQLEL